MRWRSRAAPVMPSMDCSIWRSRTRSARCARGVGRLRQRDGEDHQPLHALRVHGRADQRAEARGGDGLAGRAERVDDARHRHVELRLVGALQPAADVLLQRLVRVGRHSGRRDDGLRLRHVARRGERGQQRAGDGQRGGEDQPRAFQVFVGDEALAGRGRGVLLARHRLRAPPRWPCARRTTARSMTPPAPRPTRARRRRHRRQRHRRVQARRAAAGPLRRGRSAPGPTGCAS